MTETKADYIVKVDDEPHPAKKYREWRCRCGKVLGYTYCDSSHVTRLLVSREDGTVYHILAANVSCSGCGDRTEFHIDPRAVDNLS